MRYRRCACAHCARLICLTAVVDSSSLNSRGRQRLWNRNSKSRQSRIGDGGRLRTDYPFFYSRSINETSRRTRKAKHEDAPNRLRPKQRRTHVASAACGTWAPREPSEGEASIRSDDVVITGKEIGEVASWGLSSLCFALLFLVFLSLLVSLSFS